MERTPAPHEPSLADPPASPGTGRRDPVVLVVEDNKDILRAMQRTLALQRYRVLTAGDGEEALRVVRAEKPDLILLDVMIPKLDGLEVLRRVRADPSARSTMVILVTGRSSIDHKVQGFDAGADDYISKPFHIPELLARVRSALRLKRVTDELEERNRELVRSQRSLLQSKKMATIGLLASGIAHEFNNIMAGIAGYAQLARKDPKFRDALVDVALTQTERALELTRSLSTYNRPPEEDAACDAEKVIENALCLVAKELENTNIRVAKEYADSARIAMSPGRFQEVVLNLVINAIQAIEGGSGFVKVRVAPAPDPRQVLVEVSDTGVGIPEEHLDRIFDPFFTTKGALGGGSRSGTGLGLTVCYNIVHAHRGEIQVESQVGKGTTFQITLPRAASATGPVSLPLPLARPESPAEDRPLRILVVDDEPVTREMVRDYLSEHTVVTCSRPEQALEAYAIQPFDYVILDVCMGGPLNGLQAFERFQTFDPPPKIIFASGRFPDEGYRPYIRRAYGHLLKPYKFEELTELLGIRPRREPEGEPAGAGLTRSG